MNLTLKVWRQKNHKTKGEFQTYQVSNISSEMSFLEMFDVLNEQLIAEGGDPIANVPASTATSGMPVDELRMMGCEFFVNWEALFVAHPG